MKKGKKKGKKDTPDTPEEPLNLRGDALEQLQHLVDEEGGDGEETLRDRVERVLDRLLGLKMAEKRKEDPPAIQLIDRLHELWIATATEALFLVDEPEKCCQVTHIALQCRTCVGLLCDQEMVANSDTLVRANLDILFDLLDEAPFLSTTPALSIVKQMSKIDIPLALMHHRKELSGEEVEMKVAIADLSTGECFWAERKDEPTTPEELKGFLPIAPFYVGCSDYHEKVELFLQSMNEYGISLLPGALEQNRAVMEKCLKHLVISFRLGSTLSPQIIGPEGDEETSKV